jgi:hypothetical protein
MNSILFYSNLRNSTGFNTRLVLKQPIDGPPHDDHAHLSELGPTSEL